MSDNNQPQEDKIIVQVILTKDNQIKTIINSKHLQMLSYIHRLLGVEIDKMIIDGQIKTQMATQKIIRPGNKPHGIINFIRGKYGG